MALIGLRGLLKCGQLINENILFSNSTRSIAFTRMRRNTTVEEKSDATQTANQPPPPNIESKCNDDLAELKTLTAKLSDDNKTLLDKYKRALADGENLRARLTKQIAEARQFGIQGFCKDLLDVADVLSKATETVPKAEITDANPHLKGLYEGLMMTEAQLQSVFKRHGLEPVNPLGDKFDPHYHEALFQQEVEGQASGTVVVVSKVGYKLHDRVVRPALVGVSK